MKRLWLDEGGAVLSTELILLLVTVVIGLVVGMVALRDAIDAQLVEVGNAVGALDPGFTYTGVSYTGAAGAYTPDTFASVQGSMFAATVELDQTVTAPGVVLAAVVPDGSKFLNTGP